MQGFLRAGFRVADGKGAKEQVGRGQILMQSMFSVDLRWNWLPVFFEPDLGV